ncbi:biopolymer transport protein ExbD [Flavobacterium arsenatis]|uniref:Biopolymer transport protein ExbD n=1 Tax=Flavobacterium arsenatis TaxID=1484332 RepID=A0ABU1TKR0_9FLAO|nr:biopolymer transporter ExbD [Flavobacterium arsenatis]MDR6966565.1 biopolymer transport protein ExbD [Flavobacterium arsenatis]
MAQLDTGDSGGGKKGGKVRSKKQNSSVDLTAMVDLAFLLITFFMLTTSLSKPQSMDLAMPDKDPTKKIQDDILVSEERTMVVLLGPDDKLQMYMGQFDKPKQAPKAVGYGKDGIRKDILEKMKSVPLATRTTAKPNGEDLIVIIKPSKESDYKNLVDILDEMAICKVKVYAIDDITPQEEQLFE